jgi:hypothetical protein
MADPTNVYGTTDTCHIFVNTGETETDSVGSVYVQFCLTG